jgi:hypothetical protein
MEIEVVSYKLKDSLPLVKNEGQAENFMLNSDNINNLPVIFSFQLQFLNFQKF